MAKAQMSIKEMSEMDATAKVSVESPKAAAVAASKKYRVKETKHVSHYGMMTTIHKDTVIGDNTHGVAGIQRLKEAGLLLEEITE